MTRRSGILLAFLGAWMGLVPGVGRAAEPENPYPFGKAEVRAKQIHDVVELLVIGNKYRDRCLALIEAKRPFREIEQSGREAKNWYRQALEHEPSNSYTSLCIGYVDLTLGRVTTNKITKEDRFSSAMARFREALENRPGYARAYLYMAEIQALSNRYLEAEKNLRLVLDSNIEDSEIHSWMAYVMLKTDRPSEAHRHLARAIELDDPAAAAKWSRKHQK